MSLESASLIGGLRQSIDGMLIRMATNPELILQHSPQDDAIVQAVNALVSSKLSPSNLPPVG